MSACAAEVARAKRERKCTALELAAAIEADAAEQVAALKDECVYCNI